MATYLPQSFSKPLPPEFPYPYRVAGTYQLFPKRRRSPVIGKCLSTESVTGLTRSAETDLRYVVSEHGWGVRRLAKEDEEEMRKVSLVQAEAFHNPVALFDDFFFLFFQAEVLSVLLYKLKNSPPDRYACLVAEAERDESEGSDSGRGIVGVVDVTAMRDASVLRHFPDVDEYLYVSGLAVSKSQRRRKVGSTLLKGCDVVREKWGMKLMALRAYEDDRAARKLYANAGYRVIEADPPWFSTWLGRKRRLLIFHREFTKIIIIEWDKKQQVHVVRRVSGLPSLALSVLRLRLSLAQIRWAGSGNPLWFLGFM
ncbi:PREDICTED: uncharacterized protein LOC104809733 [Tarenaya hassleriana]|uniref:uncharacterized protein LOC104809733 n=1 Tax=Tarenaya hassleriana TaxID=28532 RepID=UPI00053C85C4|nr:PREDICTED: uncharacterized protein LOC104809733 [Tarenaya hassleriana]